MSENIAERRNEDAKPMAFREHLDHASSIVRSWPKWKREILGDKEEEMPTTDNIAELLSWCEACISDPGYSAAQMDEFRACVEKFKAEVAELRRDAEALRKTREWLADPYVHMHVGGHDYPSGVEAAFRKILARIDAFRSEP